MATKVMCAILSSKKDSTSTKSCFNPSRTQTGTGGLSSILHRTHISSKIVSVHFLHCTRQLADSNVRERESKSHNSLFLAIIKSIANTIYHGLLSICYLYVSFRPSTPPRSYHDLDSQDKVDLNAVDDYARSLCSKEGSICKIMCGCSTLYLPTYI